MQRKVLVAHGLVELEEAVEFPEEVAIDEACVDVVFDLQGQLVVGL